MTPRCLTSVLLTAAWTYFSWGFGHCGFVNLNVQTKLRWISTKFGRIVSLLLNEFTAFFCGSGRSWLYFVTRENWISLFVVF